MAATGMRGGTRPRGSARWPESTPAGPVLASHRSGHRYRLPVAVLTALQVPPQPPRHPARGRVLPAPRRACQGPARPAIGDCRAGQREAGFGSREAAVNRLPVECVLRQI